MKEKRERKRKKAATIWHIVHIETHLKTHTHRVSSSHAFEPYQNADCTRRWSKELTQYTLYTVHTIVAFLIQSSLFSVPQVHSIFYFSSFCSYLLFFPIWLSCMIWTFASSPNTLITIFFFLLFFTLFSSLCLFPFDFLSVFCLEYSIAYWILARLPVSLLLIWLSIWAGKLIHLLFHILHRRRPKIFPFSLKMSQNSWFLCAILLHENVVYCNVQW